MAWKRGAGALSGGAGSFAGPFLVGLDFAGKLVATSVIGGFASVAGGGKFENGAVTAAFGYLFNAAAGRAFGHLVGFAIGGIGGVETGPGDLFIALAMGHYLGEYFSNLEDSIYGPGGLIRYLERPTETFTNPADAIGDLYGHATWVGQGTTNNDYWIDHGFAETHYYLDSNGDQHTVFYNPRTGEFSGGHLSSGQ
jgi:hypothetical protein